jgi:hypothetical protein
MSDMLPISMNKKGIAMELQRLPSLVLAGSLIALTPRPLFAELVEVSATYSEGTVYVDWEIKEEEGAQVRDVFVGSDGCYQEFAQYQYSSTGWNSGAFYCGETAPGTKIKVTVKQGASEKTATTIVPGGDGTVNPCIPEYVSVIVRYDEWNIHAYAYWESNGYQCPETLHFAVRCDDYSSGWQWSVPVNTGSTAMSCPRDWGSYSSPFGFFVTTDTDRLADPFSASGALNYEFYYSTGELRATADVVTEWDVS